MIIDRNAHVVPPRYLDRETRAQMGDALGKAEMTDLLAAYLWVTEARLGREAIAQLDARRVHLLSDIEIVRKWKTGESSFLNETWEYTRAEVHQLFDRTSDALYTELTVLDTATEAAKTALAELLRLSEEDLAPRYAPARVDSPLNTIIEGKNVIPGINERMTDLVLELQIEADGLIALNDRRLDFRANSVSYSLDDIKRFDPTNFEILVSWLAARDGMKICRGRGGPGDQGADGIFITPDNRRVVVQCKQTRSQTRRAIGSELVQRFNGTAWQEHKADIAVMVTNGTFSEPARAFASKCGIHLIDAVRLEKWATWGDPFYEVVGVIAPSAADTAAA
ncbi:restriction endonuclease [Streptomyces sp. NPDC002526]